MGAETNFYDETSSKKKVGKYNAYFPSFTAEDEESRFSRSFSPMSRARVVDATRASPSRTRAVVYSRIQVSRSFIARRKFFSATRASAPSGANRQSNQSFVRSIISAVHSCAARF